MKDLLNGWGLTTLVFLPLVGMAVMLVIPKAEETAHKVVALAGERGEPSPSASPSWPTSATTRAARSSSCRTSSGSR